jgi:hypothetical protein
MSAPSPNTRLLSQWQPGAWIGLERRASELSTEFVEVQQPGGSGLTQAVHMHPAQRLLALWAPQSLAQPMLPRLPLRVALVTDAPDAAARALLPELPAGAKLWLCSLDADWPLIAEIALRSDAGLLSWQQEALRRFIQAEREALARSIGQRYRQGRLSLGAGPNSPTA